MKGFIQVLRTQVIIDYQNIHLTGRDWFAPQQQAGDCVVDPAAFALRAVHERNLQHPDLEPLTLAEVVIFRGEPSPYEHRKLAKAAQRQKARWEQHPDTTVVYRPLRYPPKGKKGKAEEKGIDVLCAVQAITASAREDLHAVLLATHDTDLCPVLDFSIDFDRQIETVGWEGAKVLRAHQNDSPVTDTRMSREAWQDCRDTFPNYFAD